MPFGLTNAPPGFQGLFNGLLCDFLKHFVFVYLDDVLILSKNLSQHIIHVRQVLQRLLDNQLLVKAEKCELHTEPGTF